MGIIIDGIIAGLVSTCIMTIYEIPFWRIWGIKGILEWHENQILTSKLIKKFSKTKSDTGVYTGILLLHIINGLARWNNFSIYLFIYYIIIFFTLIPIIHHPWNNIWDFTLVINSAPNSQAHYRIICMESPSWKRTGNNQFLWTYIIWLYFGNCYQHSVTL